MPLAWLPPLLTMEAHNGDWDRYCDAIYARFCADFKGDVPLHFLGKEVRLKRYPIEQNKEATFWHLISEGKIEEDRLPNMRRCERIAWPRALMDNIQDGGLKIWDEEIRGEVRTHIWCEEDDYLFVLANRRNYVMPWTAYCDIRHHMREKLRRRWIAFR